MKDFFKKSFIFYLIRLDEFANASRRILQYALGLFPSLQLGVYKQVAGWVCSSQFVDNGKNAGFFLHLFVYKLP